MTDAETTAHQIARELEDAWNAASGDAFAAPFTDDADFVDIRGDHHRGKAAIARGHQAIFDSIYRDSRVRYAVTGARVHGDVIVAFLQSALEAPHAPLPPNDGAIASLVLVRRDRWQVASFHNTLRLQAR